MIEFENYWPSFLLGLIPFYWWARGRTLTDFNAAHLTLSTTIRSLLTVALVLALMQPIMNGSGNGLSVAYLLDVSESISPQAMESAIEWISQADTEGSPDHSVFIPFAANSLVLDSLEELRTVQVSGREIEGAVDQSATNLEGSLNRAIGQLAPHHLKRIVMLTDGNENAGQVKNAVLKMKREGVPVFTVPVPARSTGDTWIEAVMAPERVTSGELFPLEVHAYSQSPKNGTIEIRLDGEILETRDVALDEGINRVGFETLVDETGPITLEVELRVDGDRFVDNNTFRESVVVLGQPRVLYIEGRPDSAHYLTDVLAMEGIEVDTIEPSAAPDTVDQFDAYEAVILSDVRADELTGRQMDAMATYVRDLGGGFILAAGDSVFGEDGYSETAVEEILPVRFDLERDKTSVALIIVLDKSGSMGGQKIELAKEASKAAVDVLEDDHLIGIIAFDYNYYWPVRFQSARNREDINQSVSMIIAGGETNIYPALREAHLQLTGIQSEVRHVILLSDGRSLPDDYIGLVESMAEEKMTVSTVAVGNGADRELLSNIAEWGEGRSYFIEDATMVPQIFTEETQLATQGTLEEEPFVPIVAKDVEAFKGIDFENAPPLLGFVSTLAKDTSEVLLEAEEDKPILARWQYGLGKTAAFTSDVKDRWAAEWLTWEGYTKFWPQLVRETMRRQDDGEIDMKIEKEGQNANITITALDENGGFRNELQSQIRVIDPQQNASVIDLHQSGPGTYEAQFPVNQRGPFVFRMIGDEANVSRILPYSYPDELHFYPPDVDLLAEVSNVTGGKFQPTAADVFSTGGETVLLRVPLWPYLAIVALLLYLTDLLLRRIRLFEGAAKPETVRGVPSRSGGTLGIS